jgi:hypothetical protein
MGDFRKPRFSKVDVEKATDGFFNRLLPFEDQVALVHQVFEPLVEDDIATPAGIKFRTMQSRQAPECCMTVLTGKFHSFRQLPIEISTNFHIRVSYADTVLIEEIR